MTTGSNAASPWAQSAHDAYITEAPLQSRRCRSCRPPGRGGRRAGRCQRQARGGCRRVRSRAAGRSAPDGRRLARRPAHHRLRRGWQDPAGTGFHRPQRIRDAGRHLQRDPERAGALLQPLFRCGDAVHAAHHLVGHRAPCRRAARLSRLSRLHPHAGGLRRAAVRHDQARSQGGGGARRHAPRRALPSGALQARPDPLTSRGRRAHSGHVGGRSADATHAARCTAACGDRGAADLAGGRRRAARGGREGEPRRPRRRAGPRSRPTPISHAP